MQVADRDALDLVLIQWLGTGGIPLATSIGSFGSFLMLLVFLERQIPGINFRSITNGFVATLTAALLLAAWAYGVWHLLDSALGRSIIAQIISLTGAMVAGTVAYLAACYGLRVPEMSLLSVLRSRLR